MTNEAAGYAACTSCGSRYSAADLTGAQIDAVRARRTLESLSEELRVLRRVTEFFQEYPHLLPADAHLHLPDDLRVFSDACGIAFEERTVPAESSPSDSADLDQETLQFMQRHAYSLGPRMSWLVEHLAELEPVCNVECPRCHQGILRVAEKDWNEFNQFDAVTFLWPAWHEFAADGTLRVKTSGFVAGEHWTGMRIIAPSESDYQFLCWLVAQRKFDRLIESRELATIRAKWERADENT
jgi:hypothetical protein